MNNNIEKGLKEIFRRQEVPVDADRLEAMRRRVLAGVPEDTLTFVPPWFRRPVFVLSSALVAFLIAVGAYIFRDAFPPAPPDPLDDIYRIVENDDQLDQLVVLLDEFISRESPRDFFEREREDFGTGIFTEDDLLPTTAEYLEKGSSLL